jgi:hypothetical protein
MIVETERGSFDLVPRLTFHARPTLFVRSQSRLDFVSQSIWTAARFELAFSFLPYLASAATWFGSPLNLLPCIGTCKAVFGLVLLVTARSSHRQLRTSTQSIIDRRAATKSAYVSCKSLRCHREAYQMCLSESGYPLRQ